nr:hypothetical protein [Tanacetum cinerariifolium]
MIVVDGKGDDALTILGECGGEVLGKRGVSRRVIRNMISEERLKEKDKMNVNEEDDGCASEEIKSSRVYIGQIRKVMGETLAESTKGTPQFGPECARVYSDLNSKEKDRRESHSCMTILNTLDNIRKSQFMTTTLALPTADPLALLSNVSNTQHGSPSLSTSSFTQLPLPRANSSSLADDLIENLTSTLALLTQSYRTFLPQTNNQLRTSSNPRNQATVQDGGVVVQNVQGRPNRGQEMNPQGGNAAGYGEAQNRVRNVNQGHIARNCTQPKRPQNSEYFKDKMMLMQDLALNVDNVFQAEDCDAFDSDVDEAPTAQTMFLANLSSADPITDEAGPSYDSDILSEVQDHDQYLDDTCAYQEEHVMHDSVQLDHVVDLHADYTIVSNMISYDQYVKDNEVPVVHSNASSVQNDTFMMIYNDMCEPSAPFVSNSSRNAVVKNSLTAELAAYREQVELYERRAKFELIEREQKINEQLRLVISDRNFKEKTLKRELHSTKLQLASTINRNKSMVEETTFLKQDFKQKENKYLADILNMKSLKEKVEDKLVKQDQSLQTVHMLCRPRPLYSEQNKVAIGYKNPLCLTQAKQAQPALYNGHEILKDNHAPFKVHNVEDTLEIAEITRKKMNAKMTDPECVTHKVKIAPHDYTKENLLATLTPQKQLNPEQIYWSNKSVYSLSSEYTSNACTQNASNKNRPPRRRRQKSFSASVFGEPKITPGHPIYPIYYITRHHSSPLSPFVHTTTPPPTPRNATSHHSPPQSPFPPTYNTTTAAQTSVAEPAATPAGTLLTTIQPHPHCHVHHRVTLSTVTIYHVTTSPRCPHHQHHHNHHSPASPPPDPPSKHHRCHYPSATNPSPPSSYRRVFVSFVLAATIRGAQNDLFRAENDKIKQHYKELYDSIKITRVKHIE